MYFQDIRIYDSFFKITKEAQTQTTWSQKKDIGTQIPRRSQREASLRCSIRIKKFLEILAKDSDIDDSDNDHDIEENILPAQKRKRGRPCKNTNKIQKLA